MSINVEVKQGSTATVAGPALLTMKGAAEALIGGTPVHCRGVQVDQGQTATITGPAHFRARYGTVQVDGAPIAGPGPGAQPPVIAALSPASVLHGTAPFACTVTGNGFDYDSVVRMGAVAMPTTFHSTRKLVAQLTPPGSAGTSNITVFNPGDGGLSSAATLTWT